MIAKVVVRQRGKMLMIALTVALGTSLASAMLNVVLDVGDKVNRELKTYGANITVLPKGALLLSDLYGMEDVGESPDMYLPEDDAVKVKTIFWAHNIVDFTPLLTTQATVVAQGEAVEEEGESPGVKVVGAWFARQMTLPTGEELDTGISRMRSWWSLEGSWLSDDDADGALLGSGIAQRYGLTPGDSLTLRGTEADASLTVRAVVDTGGEEDEQIFVTLETAQKLSGKEGLITGLEVSALTTPDNELARRAAQNPRSLSSKEYETWYCTAYASAICYQIEEAIPDAVAKPVRQVAASEGSILEKTQLLMLFITLLSMVGAALGISNLVSASVMERAAEIGLIKALGGRDLAVAWLVLLAILLVGLVGGAVGYVLGLGFAQIIGHTVFGSPIAAAPMVIPLLAVILVLVIVLGSLPALRSILRLRPAEVLHGR
jgi:putative ABC transport system permease protein